MAARAGDVMSVSVPEPRPRNAVVTFDQNGPGRDPQSFQAARLDVLLVLKFAGVMQWGWLLKFAGTETELIAAGVATADMFRDLGKSGQKTADTPFGDRYQVRRRVKGRYEIELRLMPKLCDLSDPRTQATLWWRQHAPAVEAEVAHALEEMRRPRVQS
jgi:hypothetical protein